MTEFGREPTVEEIAEVAGIEATEVEAITRAAQEPISLDKPVGDDEVAPSSGTSSPTSRPSLPTEHAVES